MIVRNRVREMRPGERVHVVATDPSHDAGLPELLPLPRTYARGTRRDGGAPGVRHREGSVALAGTLRRRGDRGRGGGPRGRARAGPGGPGSARARAARADRFGDQQPALGGDPRGHLLPGRVRSRRRPASAARRLLYDYCTSHAPCPMRGSARSSWRPGRAISRPCGAIARRRGRTAWASCSGSMPDEVSGARARRALPGRDLLGKHGDRRQPRPHAEPAGRPRGPRRRGLAVHGGDRACARHGDRVGVACGDYELSADTAVNAAGLSAPGPRRGVPSGVPGLFRQGPLLRALGASPFTHLVYPVAESGGLGVHVHPGPRRAGPFRARRGVDRRCGLRFRRGRPGTASSRPSAGITPGSTRSACTRDTRASARRSCPPGATGRGLRHRGAGATWRERPGQPARHRVARHDRGARDRRARRDARGFLMGPGIALACDRRRFAAHLRVGGSFAGAKLALGLPIAGEEAPPAVASRRSVRPGGAGTRSGSGPVPGQ